MNRRTARFRSPYPFASTSLAALASVLLAAAARPRLGVPAAPMAGRIVLAVAVLALGGLVLRAR